MTKEEVLNRARQFGLPGKDYEYMKSKLDDRADPNGDFEVYEGTGRGCVSGRHYARCFDVLYVLKPALVKYDVHEWYVYQDHGKTT